MAVNPTDLQAVLQKLTDIADTNAAALKKSSEKESTSRIAPLKTRDAQDWINFKVQFETVARLNKWSLDKQKDELRSHMTGEAMASTLDIDLSLNDNNVSLKDVLARFDKVFLSEANSEAARTAFKLVKQEELESIEDFYIRTRNLHLQAYPGIDLDTSDRAIDQFIENLLDDGVSRQLLISKPKTFKACLDAAVNQRAVELKMKDREGKRKAKTNPPKAAAANNSMGDASAGVNNIGGEGCWTCGLTGHIARQCNLAPPPSFRGRGRGQGKGNFNAKNNYGSPYNRNDNYSNRGRGGSGSSRGGFGSRGGGRRGRGRGSFRPQVNNLNKNETKKEKESVNNIEAPWDNDAGSEEDFV